MAVGELVACLRGVGTQSCKGRVTTDMPNMRRQQSFKGICTYWIGPDVCRDVVGANGTVDIIVVLGLWCCKKSRLSKPGFSR